MHMADALLSPAVGGAAWLLAGGALAWAARGLREERREHLVPLMGVSGAFVFAAQMVNFSIPGTGSSGHLAGGLLLAVLLGPHAAFLTLFSVLLVQALFFADGGLLALGCNAINMGFFACYLAYPLVWRPIAGALPSRGRLLAASLLAAVLALQGGALGVVVQTRLSGISALPFGPFSALMLPIHLAIGLAEGLATAAVVAFVRRARPEVLAAVPSGASPRRLLLALGLAAGVVAGGLSWFASSQPDGLEWSVAGAADREALPLSAGRVHATLAAAQERSVLLPDYDLPAAEQTAREAWPAVDGGTSLAGLVGAGLTLLLAAALGLVLRGRARPAAG